MMIRCLAFLIIFVIGCAEVKPAEAVNLERAVSSRISVSSEGDVATRCSLYIVKVDGIEYLIATGYNSGTAIIKLEKANE